MVMLGGVDSKAMLFVPAIGIGLAWGSIMGNPYVILAGSIPPERTGVYMGIFNMMIVIPMILFAVTMPFLYGGGATSLFGIIEIGGAGGMLGGDPRNVLMLSGGLMIAAALSVLWEPEGWRLNRMAPVGQSVH
jgi:maltose/moltooligosaccharide transporter